MLLPVLPDTVCLQYLMQGHVSCLRRSITQHFHVFGGWGSLTTWSGTHAWMWMFGNVFDWSRGCVTECRNVSAYLFLLLFLSGPLWQHSTAAMFLRPGTWGPPLLTTLETRKHTYWVTRSSGLHRSPTIQSFALGPSNQIYRLPCQEKLHFFCRHRVRHTQFCNNDRTLGSLHNWFGHIAAHLFKEPGPL